MASPTITPEPAAQPQGRRGRRWRPRRPRWVTVVLLATNAVAVAALVAVVVYWFLYLLPPAPDPFTRGPFLIRLSETGAKLAWTLPGGGPVSLAAVSPAGTTVIARDGRFSGLKPGTRYVWTASVGGDARSSGSFTTAPATLATPITFAVIGDYGSGNEHEWEVARTLAAESPDFVLTAGDNSYLAAVPQNLDRNIFEPLHQVMTGAPVWATEGEHDLFFENGRFVTDALHLPGTAGRWVIDYGPVQIVALGLQADAASIAQLRRLSRTTHPAVRFVLVHRPIGPSDPIARVLRATGVTAVFSGHLHRYERRVVGGVNEFTVGVSGQGPGAPQFTRRSPDAIVSLLNYGSLRVDIAGGVIRYAFIDENGHVLDSATQHLPAR
ncbi:MAG TPA: metallophosphoesterase [Gaiellales bacterium]|nr:metallophosphoesterase [Gaiellales bacterium]